MPGALPSSIAGPTTQEAGYFAAPHTRVADWFHADDGKWSVGSPRWTSLQDAAAALTPTAPITRYAFVDLAGWTLMLNNGPNGTDVGLMPSLAARELRCRAIRAVCVPDEGPGYPARILEVYGPDTESPLALERSVVAADDGGRWVFEASGRPYEFEDGDSRHRRHKRDRFTCEMLHRYLRALGVPATAEPDWATAVLIELLPT
ncbi:hypothetical protein [Kribbella endophytica]